MPFDVTKASGTWTFDSGSENYSQIMEKMGVPPEMVEILRNAGYPVEMSLSEKTLKFKVNFMGKVDGSTYTLDEEGVEETPSGKTRKVIYSLKGECLECSYPDHDGKGLKVWTSKEFVNDNTIRVTMQAGDLKGWAITKRC